MKFNKITKYEDLPQESGDYLVYLHTYFFEEDTCVLPATYFRNDGIWKVDDDRINAYIPFVRTEDLECDYVSHWAPMPEFKEEDDTTCEEIKNEHLSRN